MASDHDRDNRLLQRANELRGLDQQLLAEARGAGKQLSQQVSKVQTVQEVSGPAATPKVRQDQSSPVRERHVAEKQQQNSVGGPGGGQVQTQQAKSPAEIAQALRQAGVTGGRSANDIAPAKQTPAMEEKKSRGRGR